MRIDAIDVFCDPFKAFDCVHHIIMAKKLCHYSIAGYGFHFIKCKRIQRVVVNGTRSFGFAVGIGVPQGSVLGPFVNVVITE